jgi:hypothetical protein
MEMMTFWRQYKERYDFIWRRSKQGRRLFSRGRQRLRPLRPKALGL